MEGVCIIGFAQRLDGHLASGTSSTNQAAPGFSTRYIERSALSLSVTLRRPNEMSDAIKGVIRERQRLAFAWFHTQRCQSHRYYAASRGPFCTWLETLSTDPLRSFSRPEQENFAVRSPVPVDQHGLLTAYAAAINHESLLAMNTK